MKDAVIEETIDSLIISLHCESSESDSTDSTSSEDDESDDMECFTKTAEQKIIFFDIESEKTIGSNGKERDPTTSNQRNTESVYEKYNLNRSRETENTSQSWPDQLLSLIHICVK